MGAEQAVVSKWVLRPTAFGEAPEFVPGQIGSPNVVCEWTDLADSRLLFHGFIRLTLVTPVTSAKGPITSSPCTQSLQCRRRRATTAWAGHQPWEAAPGPTFSTTPAISCPGTMGYFAKGKRPCCTLRSLWQTSQACTRMSTSPDFAPARHDLQWQSRIAVLPRLLFMILPHKIGIRIQTAGKISGSAKVPKRYLHDTHWLHRFDSG